MNKSTAKEMDVTGARLLKIENVEGGMDSRYWETALRMQPLLSNDTIHMGVAPM
jgi:hypothetical protein